MVNLWVVTRLNSFIVAVPFVEIMQILLFKTVFHHRIQKSQLLTPRRLWSLNDISLFVPLRIR